jgi:hypothetical protein
MSIFTPLFDFLDPTNALHEESDFLFKGNGTRCRPDFLLSNRCGGSLAFRVRSIPPPLSYAAGCGEPAVSIAATCGVGSALCQPLLLAVACQQAFHLEGVLCPPHIMFPLRPREVGFAVRARRVSDELRGVGLDPCIQLFRGHAGVTGICGEDYCFARCLCRHCSAFLWLRECLPFPPVLVASALTTLAAASLCGHCGLDEFRRAC